ISPTHYLADGSLHKTTRYWTSAITLPYLKALTPSDHEVTFTDELMHDLDVAQVERESDVVGITAMAPQIRRAHALPDQSPARIPASTARSRPTTTAPSGRGRSTTSSPTSSSSARSARVGSSSSTTTRSPGRERRRSCSGG